MKILFIDNAVSGHHVSYIKELTSNKEYESCVVLPQKVEEICCEQIIVKYPKQYDVRTSGRFAKILKILKTEWQYALWLFKIKNLIKKYSPDVVHHLTGDVFYNKFYCWVLKHLKTSKSKLVLTVHRTIFENLTKDDIKTINKNVDCNVFHSEYIMKASVDCGITNADFVEYPCFEKEVIDKNTACKYYGLPKDVSVISVVGKLRFEKGTDLLLKAMRKVDCPFKLVVATLDGDFDKADLISDIDYYKENVKIIDKDFLSNQELQMLIACSDVIALPYRKKFNGASGPLSEGVWNKKCIVGPKHGNLGYTIIKNHLGYVFDTENIDSLTESLTLALSGKYVLDDEYLNYRNSLSVDNFLLKYNSIYTTLLKR